MSLQQLRFPRTRIFSSDIDNELGAGALSVTDVQPDYTDIEYEDTATDAATVSEFMLRRGHDPAVGTPAAIAGRHLRIRTVSGSVTLDGQDEAIFIDPALAASITLTLPSASSLIPGKMYCIGDQSGVLTVLKTVTIARTGSDLIGGQTSIVLATAGAGITLVGDGSSGYAVVGQGL